ncbi:MULTISPECIES: hypothetical protein [unclassified Streptomyces]|uniref:hypothetical protein n=1 Tax=unclassified Streptomyces TaxID=2593676 RepID=UPI0021566A3E|nr:MULTISPECIES: hypothetical protein [unclassified Streptomyces]
MVSASADASAGTEGTTPAGPVAFQTGFPIRPDRLIGARTGGSGTPPTMSGGWRW